MVRLADLPEIEREHLLAKPCPAFDSTPWTRSPPLEQTRLGTQTFWQSAIALASGVSPGPMGSAHPLAAPYQAFRTADGWINVGASNESTWAHLTEALARPDLRDDPRFATNRDRIGHVEALEGVLAPCFLERTTEAWLGVLDLAGVPAGPVASVGEMLEHPQTLARGMVVEVEHTRLGRVRSLGSPVKLSGQGPEGLRPGAPILGEHTREVLLEAGYSGEDIDGLIEEGVASEPEP